MTTSQQIGKQLEDQVDKLLTGWRVSYKRHKKFRTNLGNLIETDFYLPRLKTRSAVVIECKNFGVDARSLPNSRKRKVEESLNLLIQICRYCPDTFGSTLILVTGKERFLPWQVSLLMAELGPNFHVLSIDDPSRIRKELGLESEGSLYMR